MKDPTITEQVVKGSRSNACFLSLEEDCGEMGAEGGLGTTFHADEPLESGYRRLREPLEGVIFPCKDLASSRHLHRPNPRYYRRVKR